MRWPQFDILASNKRGSAKAALLDQRFLAGLGNLYADESLFQASIHPQAQFHRLGEERREEPYRSIQMVLNAALDSGADISCYPKSFLLAHRHPGGLCPWDGERLEVRKVAGRTTYLCPCHQVI